MNNFSFFLIEVYPHYQLTTCPGAGSVIYGKHRTCWPEMTLSSKVVGLDILRTFHARRPTKNLLHFCECHSDPDLQVICKRDFGSCQIMDEIGTQKYSEENQEPG